jgi:hypothetical protein
MFDNVDWQSVAVYLFPLIPVMWGALGLSVGWVLASRKHDAVLKEIAERDVLLDQSNTNALEAKDETINVLRGMLYATADAKTEEAPALASWQSWSDAFEEVKKHERNHADEDKLETDIANSLKTEELKTYFLSIPRTWK